MTSFKSSGVLVAAACLFGTAAAAQESPTSDDVQAGRAVAMRVCLACHVLAPDQPMKPILDPPASSFVSIANGPGATAASLRAFLQTTHKTLKTFRDVPMPNITDEQADAVIAYILSLKANP